MLSRQYSLYLDNPHTYVVYDVVNTSTHVPWPRMYCENIRINLIMTRIVT